MLKKIINLKLSRLTVFLSGFLFVILLGSGVFFKSIFLPETSKAGNPTAVLGETIVIPKGPSPSLPSSPSPSPKSSIKPVAKASVKPSVTPAASSAASSSSVGQTSSSPSPTASSTTASPLPGTTSAPSSSPSPSSIPSPSPAQSTVNLEIQGSGFTVEISGDLNVCQVLERAKEQGKLSSLTLDDSYKSSLNSLYVREINGLSNNWTFKVNGNSPLGCSLYTVKPGDQIVFKFG